MSNSATSIWQARPEIDAAAKALWPNHTASQVAAKLSAQFDIAVTRNAVLGRLTRTGYSTEQKDVVHPSTNYRRRLGKPLDRELRTVPTMQRPLVCEPLPSLELSLDDLRAEQCHYIAGDVREGAGYCGHPVFKRSYCQAHYWLCFRMPNEGRR